MTNTRVAFKRKLGNGRAFEKDAFDSIRRQIPKSFQDEYEGRIEEILISSHSLSKSTDKEEDFSVFFRLINAAKTKEYVSLALADRITGRRIFGFDWMSAGAGVINIFENEMVNGYKSVDLYDSRTETEHHSYFVYSPEERKYIDKAAGYLEK